MGDSEEEDYCQYGTPLEPYEEDEVPKKKSAFQDITEQYALDAQGRRRFHGAFTGGFSAGHWNTVSTPEGWAPQAFKSSRSDRKALTQKPEDFMDDEDRAEFGIAPKQVHTTKDFSGAKRKNQKYFNDGPIPGVPVLQTLLEPVHETVAIKILKSMGWRPGRGIGEKISYKEKKKAKKMYTCYIPQEFRTNERPEDDDEEANDEDSDESYSEVLFEPDDFEPYVAKPKVDAFGLGYVGLSRHSILGAFSNPSNDADKKMSHLLTSDKGRKVSIRGQAFGVGALEEEDEDIYSKEDLSSYDFSLDVSKNAGKTDSKSKNVPSSSRTVLEGFIPASTSALLTKVYPLPALPPGYVPKGVKKSRFSTTEGMKSTEITPRDQSLGRHDLTAKQRGKILGENDHAAQTPKNDPPSKTDSPKTLEEKMATITGRSINFTSDSDSKPSDSDAKQSDSDAKPSEPTPSSTPKSDGIFRPFAPNPAKQERYEDFVAMKKGLPNNFNKDEATDDKISRWEKERELLEFEQAYKLYKPLTGSMKDRFVTATHQEDLSNPLLIQKDKDYFLYASNERQEAARLGQFGEKTRDIVTWRPEPLLCKRFNVPEPCNGGYATQSADKKKSSFSLFEYLEAPAYDKNSYLREQTQQKLKEMNRQPKPVVTEQQKTPAEQQTDPKAGGKKKRITVAELFLQEKEKEREKMTAESKKLSFQKEIAQPTEPELDEIKETIDNFNKIDLYKAIFLSGSESENEESEPPAQSKPSKFVDVTPKNVEKNPSPPRGIFANLNFERINSWRKPDTESVPNKEPEEKKKPEEKPDVDVYGPKLPDKSTSKDKQDRIVISDESSSDSSDWVESSRDTVKKSKKSKSKKRSKKSGKSSKHHKHKTKKKHRH